MNWCGWGKHEIWWCICRCFAMLATQFCHTDHVWLLLEPAEMEGDDWLWLYGECILKMMISLWWAVRRGMEGMKTSKNWSPRGSSSWSSDQCWFSICQTRHELEAVSALTRRSQWLCYWRMIFFPRDIMSPTQWWSQWFRGEAHAADLESPQVWGLRRYISWEYNFVPNPSWERTPDLFVKGCGFFKLTEDDNRGYISLTGRDPFSFSLEGNRRRVLTAGSNRTIAATYFLVCYCYCRVVLSCQVPCLRGHRRFVHLPNRRCIDFCPLTASLTSVGIPSVLLWLQSCYLHRRELDCCLPWKLWSVVPYFLVLFFRDMAVYPMLHSLLAQDRGRC